MGQAFCAFFFVDGSSKVDSLSLELGLKSGSMWMSLSPCCMERCFLLKLLSQNSTDNNNCKMMLTYSKQKIKRYRYPHENQSKICIMAECMHDYTVSLKNVPVANLVWDETGKAVSIKNGFLL